MIENYETMFDTTPSKDEIIIMRFNPELIDLDEAKLMHGYVQEKFPDNKVVTLPYDTYLRYYSKESAKDLLNQIQNNLISYIEETNND